MKKGRVSRRGFLVFFLFACATSVARADADADVAAAFADGVRLLFEGRPAESALAFDRVAAARAALLPVGADARVPMREILELFAGRGTPEAVLAAAENGTEPAVRNQRCYAHLYLGLHAEACGRDDDAKRHMRLAAGPYAMDHFTGRIAQLHVRLRGWDEP